MGHLGDRPTGRRLARLTGPDHARDDAGGVWIYTGVVLGLIVYAGVVVAWYAGFTAAAPFVVIPAVLVVLVGAGNLISGKRPGRPAPRFNRPDPVPLTTLRRDGGTTAGHDGTGPDSTGPDANRPDSTGPDSTTTAARATGTDATGTDADPTSPGPGR